MDTSCILQTWFDSPNKATHENIKQTKEFGVNLCSTDQSIMSSVAGGYTGSRYNKINALKELGFEFYEAKKIKVTMIKGAALNIECILSKEIPLGDHTTFIGEAIKASNNADKVPLAYHGGKVLRSEYKCYKTFSRRARKNKEGY